MLRNTKQAFTTLTIRNRLGFSSWKNGLTDKEIALVERYQKNSIDISESTPSKALPIPKHIKRPDWIDSSNPQFARAEQIIPIYSREEVKSRLAIKSYQKSKLHHK